MLVLKDEVDRLPPEPPMRWISPLNQASDEKTLFHYCKKTTIHVTSYHLMRY